MMRNPALFVLGTLGIAVPALAQTSEWADAYRPIIECGIHLPADFDPADPVVIVAYTNTSDRCPVYEIVPVHDEDRKRTSPAIGFDGASAQDISPGDEYWGNGLVEIPPLTAVSVPYRVGDVYEVPAKWERMWVCPVSNHELHRRWAEYSRDGKELKSGTYGERPYSEAVSSAWRIARASIRADIRRYAEMKTKGIPMRPKIGDDVSPTGVVERLPGVEIVDGMVRYPPRPSAATNAPSVSLASPAAVSSAPPAAARHVAPLLAALAALSLGALTWILLRRRKPEA